MMNINDSKNIIDKVVNAANNVILGKEHTIRLALACLLARGHLLIEDLPGVGKTTLAHTLARLMGLDYSRIQFTSDMLPADILGVSVYEQQTATFQFHQGPVFSQLVLADEINRSTPKTQSALLEAMEEGQITIEGNTYLLPKPFFVIATQNPSFQIGTFPLPESQLDRFLMKISLGYPDPEAERNLLGGEDRRDMINHLETVLPLEKLLVIQDLINQVYAADAILDYIQALVSYSRNSGEFVNGLSPRAALGLLRSARAWALMLGRDHVIPDDIQTVLPAVVSHRLNNNSAEFNDEHANINLLLSVTVP